MPAPAARIRSARLPCGTSSSSISPARYFASNWWLSCCRGNEQMTRRTRPAPMSAARPTSPLPALLLTTVRSRVPLSTRASMSSTGCPAGPKPPMSTVAPSGMSATASIALWVIMTMAVPLGRPAGAYAVQRRSRDGSGADVLEHDRETLPDTDADARHAPPAAAALQVAGEGAEDAAARGPERVADGDGATVPVDDLRVDRPGVEARERLCCERLVELDGGDVVPGDAGPRERGVRRLDGGVAEVLGLERARAAPCDPGDGGETDLVAGCLAAEQHGRRAVVERRCVAGRDGAALLAEGRAQSGQPLRRGVGTDRLVAGEVDAGHGDDELVVPAVVPRLVGEAVRPLGEGVLAVSGDAVLLAQLLGGFAERHRPLRRHGRLTSRHPRVVEASARSPAG